MRITHSLLYTYSPLRLRVVGYLTPLAQYKMCLHPVWDCNLEWIYSGGSALVSEKNRHPNQSV